MLGQGITAGISILLNLLLIPLIGFVGAALSTLITEIFLFMIYYLFVSKSWYYYNFLGILPKPIIAAIAMSLFIGFTSLNLIITIVASAAIYLAVLMVLRTLDKKDYEIIGKIFKNEG